MVMRLVRLASLVLAKNLYLNFLDINDGLNM
jgi:hypothetical protein